MGIINPIHLYKYMLFDFEPQKVMATVQRLDLLCRQQKGTMPGVGSEEHINKARRVTE